MSSHDIGNANKANTRFNLNDSVLKLRHFAMVETCDKWLGHVKIAFIMPVSLHETYLLLSGFQSSWGALKSTEWDIT